MAITISKTSAGRLSIDDGSANHPVFYRLPISIEPDVKRNKVVLTLEAAEGSTHVVKLDVDDVTVPAQTAIGDATFDFTGGAQEDLWTKATHGLAVGDPVMFSAVGTGASEYLISTPYWVITVPTANTFQLSDSLGGSVVEGTADSAGTWTLTRYGAVDLATVIEAAL